MNVCLTNDLIYSLDIISQHAEKKQKQVSFAYSILVHCSDSKHVKMTFRCTKRGMIMLLMLMWINSEKAS